MYAFDFLGRGNGLGKSGQETSSSPFERYLLVRRLRAELAEKAYRPDPLQVAEALLTGPRAELFWADLKSSVALV